MFRDSFLHITKIDIQPLAFHHQFFKLTSQ